LNEHGTNTGRAAAAGFSGPRPPASINLSAYCLGSAPHRDPDKAALIVIEDAAAPVPAEIWTYRDIETAVQRVAGGFAALGFRPGARIVLQLGNTSAFPIVFFGAIAAGLVPVPTSTALTASELAFIIADSGADALVCDDAGAAPAVPAGVRVLAGEDVRRLFENPEPRAYAETQADDPAYLVYTSGTTASPKGVIHAHRAAWGRRPMYQGWYGITAADRILHAGAFNWTFTLGTGLTDPWANGATAVIYTGEKDPALWPRLIEKTGATMFAAVPGVIRQILKHADLGATRMPSLRHALIAGEAPPPGLFEEWTARTGRELFEALGMSEISTYVSSGPNVPRKPGAVGRPQPGRAVAILAEDGGTDPLPPGKPGLIAVHRSDPGLMLGYWNRPGEEASVYRGDWFVGGDLGVMDEEGYITHLGRADDVMKALGYRIAPQEVEAVLASHTGVAECACATLEVKFGVNIVCAYIVPSDPAAPPSRDELSRYAAERLAAYKCPREFRFVANLARTRNGKVMRSALSQAPDLNLHAAASPNHRTDIGKRRRRTFRLRIGKGTCP
jgi:acyl-coenzyme A synthetase/AMP-(fatty) acid ligase